jgi:hypothetical protein
VVLKVDPKQVGYFTLVPVGGAPDTGNGFDFGVLTSDSAFQPKALSSGNRMEMVDHLETRLDRIAINGCDIAQPDEIQLRFQLAADFDDTGRFDLQSEFSAIVFSGDDGIRDCDRRGKFVERFRKHRTSGLSVSVGRPVQHSHFPDVEKSAKDQPNKDQHLEKGKHLLLVIQFLVNDNPGIKENRFDIKQDKQHADQIKFDTKLVPGIAGRFHSTLVGRIFYFIFNFLT